MPATKIYKISLLMSDTVMGHKTKIREMKYPVVY